MKDSPGKENRAKHNKRKSFPENKIPAGSLKSSPNPRKAALDILNKYFESGTPLKSLISEILDSSGLSSIDRRFAFNLVKGTIRYVIRLDFIISYLTAKRGLEDIDHLVLNILRMGVFQCQFMDRVPAYSIVDESVKLTKSEKKYAAGFVNAVMRKASSIENTDIFLEGLLKKKKLEEARVLSIRYSYPEWIIKYWMEHFGRQKTIKLCRYLNRTPGFYLRINSTAEGMTGSEKLKSIGASPVHLKASGLGVLEAGFTEVFGPVVSSILPEGECEIFGQAASIRSAAGLEKEKLFLEGKVTVQDLSSQMAVRYFLDPGPGDKILDVCAAPGGKTSYIAELMKGKGKIVAVDISDEKLGLLRQNISRMGAGIVRTYRADASKKDFLADDRYYGYFDRILVDAPCSALGTISKNPEVKYNKRMEDLERLSDMALAILSSCGPYLKKGGRLVFYTCTLSPVENQQTVDTFIRNMDHKYIIEEIIPTGHSAAPLKTGGNIQLDDKNLSVKMQLEIMPYYLGSEGGFVSVLKKEI